MFQVGIRPDNYNGKYILTYGCRDYIKNNDYYYLDTALATAWILVSGNMDYLKTSNGQTCPDGQKLKFGVKTSCK